MKAGVYYGPGDVRVCDRPEPEPRPDNLIAEVFNCAICGTDLKLATVGNPRCKPPRIIGHEMVGRIVHVGDKVSGFAVGERITLATTVACGDCALCGRGLGNMCANARPISYEYDGAFAEKVAIPPLAIKNGNVVKVPDNLPNSAGALSEPLSCAINAMELAGVKSGDRVVILGGGPLGALHAELVKAMEAEKVLIVQRSEPRLSLLRKLSNVIVVDGANENVAERVREETDGLGADCVVVCGPSREAYEQSIGLARKGGAISLFASLPSGNSDVTFDSRAIHYGELRIVGASDSRPEHVRKAVRLLSAGKIDTDAIITHRLPLDKMLDGIDLMKQKRCLKVLVQVGAE